MKRQRDPRLLLTLVATRMAAEDARAAGIALADAWALRDTWIRDCWLRGASLREISLATGLHKSALSRIVSGARKRPANPPPTGV